MTNLDPDVAELLEEIAPPTPTAVQSDGWESIVREARAPRRRFLLRGVPASVAAVAACLLIVLAWPFGGGTGSGVLDRALAALGDGPVVHVVREGSWGGTVVDLGSGARTEYPGIDEDWYDAGRNLQRHVSRLGGVVQDDTTFHPSRAPADIVGLATRYRESLQNGTAVVASQGDVDGIPVDWIKVRSELLPDVADGKLHEWAQEIAVSRGTFQPVATRELRDGVDSGDTLQRIRELEYVSEDAAGFANAESQVRGPFLFSAGFGDGLSLAEARAVLPQLVWPGDEVAGLPFARAAKLEYKSGYDRARDTWQNVMTGVSLAYGRLADPRAGRFDGPSVVVRETLRRPPFGQSLAPFTPPPGKAYVNRGSAVLESHGVFVQIQAPDDATALAAARAVSAGSAARR